MAMASTNKSFKFTKENILEKGILEKNEANVSFESFPYYVNDSVKNALITSSFVPLKLKGQSKLSVQFPATEEEKVLLSGPAGSGIYQDTLVEALAKHFDATLFVFNIKLALIIAGVSEDLLISPDTDKSKSSYDKGAFDVLGILSDNTVSSLINTLFETVQTASAKKPLILYLPNLADTINANLKISNLVKEGLKTLSNNVVVIVSQSPVDTKKPKRRPREVPFSKFHNDQKGFMEFVFSTKADAETLFPNHIRIQLPKDENLAKELKSQFESDTETEVARANNARIKRILDANNITCKGLEQEICFKERSLSDNESIQIVTWALIHHINNNATLEGQKLVISSESIQHGLSVVGNLSKPCSSLDAKERLKNVVTDDKFESDLLGAVVAPGDIGVSFQDIGANDNIKTTLKELVMLPLQRPELFKSGSLNKPCKGILLFGPPGTGKTMLAKAVATETAANFLNISVSTLTSKYLGEGQKMVRALFSLASKISPCVIFIDEVDCLLSKRDNPNEHESMRQLKNEFMVNWDGLTTKSSERVMVLAATNRPYDLDDAVIRRLPRRLMVDLPNTANRVKILDVILSKEDISMDVDLDEVAEMTKRYSGSDIKNLCKAAAYRPIRELLENERIEKEQALAEGRSPPRHKNASDIRAINMEDLVAAHKQVYASVSSESANMKDLADWNAQFGEGGSRKTQDHFGYYM